MYCFYCMEKIEDGAQVCAVCGHKPKADNAPHCLKQGTVLNEKYLIGRVLGEGGFGITYIGRDETLDIPIAVKEYFPKGQVSRFGASSPKITVSSKKFKEHYNSGKARFLKEARILAKFRAEQNVVNVRDFFELNNTVYIVMDFLTGRDLRTFIDKNGRQDADRIVNWFMPLMKTLQKIHEQGLIHRDISPDNIIVEDGSLVLIDFGSIHDVNNINSTSIMLKPGYAPIEQYYSNGRQGPWTDIYALCATLYRCITGAVPPEATGRVMNQDNLKKLSELGVILPEETENAIMKGLSVNIEDRWQSVNELIAALKGNIDSENAPSGSEQKQLADGAENELTEAVFSAHSEEENTASDDLIGMMNEEGSSRGEKKKYTPPQKPTEDQADNMPTVDVFSFGETLRMVPAKKNPVLIIAAVCAVVVLLSIGGIGIFNRIKSASDSGTQSTASVSNVSEKTSADNSSVVSISEPGSFKLGTDSEKDTSSSKQSIFNNYDPSLFKLGCRGGTTLLLVGDTMDMLLYYEGIQLVGTDWRSGNSEILTVENGEVTGVGVGTTFVECAFHSDTGETYTYKYDLKVVEETDSYYSSIEADAEKLSVYSGSSETVNFTIDMDCDTFNAVCYSSSGLSMGFKWGELDGNVLSLELISISTEGDTTEGTVTVIIDTTIDSQKIYAVKKINIKVKRRGVYD